MATILEWILFKKVSQRRIWFWSLSSFPPIWVLIIYILFLKQFWSLSKIAPHEIGFWTSRFRLKKFDHYLELLYTKYSFRASQYYFLKLFWTISRIVLDKNSFWVSQYYFWLIWTISRINAHENSFWASQDSFLKHFWTISRIVPHESTFWVSQF